MRGPRQSRTASGRRLTWDELTARLAEHLNWLYRTAPRRGSVQTRIERLHDQLGLTKQTAQNQRAKAGGRR